MTDNESTASEVTKVNTEPEDGFPLALSQESSFYGSQITKTKLERRVRDSPLYDFHAIQNWSIGVVASTHSTARTPVQESQKRKRVTNVQLSSTASKKVKVQDDPRPDNTTSEPTPKQPHNPYEGCSNALQLNESVDDFLKRSPPSSARSWSGWIHCVNFNASNQAVKENVTAFKQEAGKALEKYAQTRKNIESFHPAKPPVVVTKAMTPYTRNLEEEIAYFATRNGIVSGKWMLFPTKDQIDEFWGLVVRGTVEGRLGTSAKVATKSGQHRDSTRVICVYTKDFCDKEDIKRVLVELVKLKLAAAVVKSSEEEANPKGQIWYKPDSYSHLDLKSGNAYNIRVSVFGTADLLTVDDVKKK